MATVAPVSISEYLKTGYRPDVDFVDDHIEERNLGEYDHANLQGILIFWLMRQQHEWKIRVLPEQRVRVSPTRFRIPDICVISREQEIEPVFTKPPLLVIEVLSKDDTLRSLQDRVDDYRAFGIPNIWVVDPVKRRAYVCVHGDFREPHNETLGVPESPIQIPLRDLFSSLD